MVTAANLTTTSSTAVCACGNDHGSAETRGCPLFETINRFNKKIEEFLDIEKLLKFGEHGAMADCLYSMVDWKITETTAILDQYEDAVESHPEWGLTEEVSRSRTYFDQVAKGCTEQGEPCTLDPPTLPLTKNASGDNYSLRNAKLQTLFCMVDCHQVIKEYVQSGAVPVSCTHDPKGYLSRVDETFKRAVDAIIIPSDIENGAAQSLMKRCNEIWAESRRVLCDFTRPHRNAAA